MSTRPQELSKIIADLRQIIVGKVAMPTDQIEQITLFLFLKQLSKKHDELVRIGAKELIFTGEWERYHFDVLLRQSGEELVKECREAVESLYKNPHIDSTVRKVFEHSYLKILEPKVLSSFLQNLNDKFSDGLDLGDFYESLLPILGTQNELGQFRTPRHIIKFIIQVIDPNIGEKICDPACGTAGFLVAAYNYIKEKYTKNGRLTLDPEQTKKLYNDTIFGWDMEPLMVKFSLANLYLHGLKVPNVSENDTLLNENLWQHTFDIIVANPPFITPKGGAKRHSRFAITSNKTEVLFCEWIVNHLNFNGRMGIIVPEGIIFDASKGHREVRKLFLDNGLWCVVSLPSGVFQPYAGVKTCIIFLDKTLNSKKVLFYEIENHGYSLNTNPTPINKNDLPEALKIINKHRLSLQKSDDISVSEQKCYTISKDRINENKDLILSARLYKEKKINESASTWESIELKNLTKVFADGDWIESKDQSNNGIRLIQTGNIGIGIYKDKGGRARYISSDTFKRLDCTEVFSDDVLISRLPDPVGRACMVPRMETKMITSVDCTIIRFDETKILPKYFLFISKSKSYSEEISRYLTGASRQRISRSNLAKIKIPVPPLEIQKEIVSELERYQIIIDGANQVIENWKPSFEIDSKWVPEKLMSLAKMVRGPFGGHLKKEIFKSSGYLIYEQYHAINNDFDFGRYFIDKDKFEEMRRFEVFTDDILISCSGTMGKVAVVPNNHKKGIINQALLKLSVDKSKISPQFLKYILESEPIQQRYFQNQSGVAIQNVASVKVLSQIEIPLPSLEIQSTLIQKIDEEQKIIEANKKMTELFQKKIDAKVKTIWES
jgi:type I restriction enzyme M protein